MINPIQNIAVYLEVGVLNPQGKLQTGLVVTYTINKCSDNSLLTSGTASETGVTGIYSFSYTFTTVAEYRLHWITPATYEDGFELISVLAPIITPSTLTAAQVWDYLLTAILTPGSIGQLLKDDIDAKISTRSVLTAQQVWDVLLTSLVTPGSIGKLLVDNIDTKLSDLPTLFWSKVIDGTYTADKVLKIMASILAGKTVIVDTGNNTATVTFRNLDDTSDVVKANMSNSERITMTLTP